MREIKFRGKDILNKNWYYGSLAKDESQKQYYIINNQYGSGTDVKEDTIGQYTGLKDKNGVEIYKGDIVLIDKINNIIGVVEYSEQYASYIVTNTNSVTDEAENLSDYNEIEAIGNIYDNPELLKAGD